jgi:Na+/proline symporter
MPIESLPGLGLGDWAVIAGFFATTLGIGLYFSRRAKASLADYFVAGRKMTWWVAGTSIVATSFAADTPLVISGWSRTVGLERNWFWWGGIMGMMLCTFFFARLWRRAKLLTDVEFVELRYAGAPAAGLRMFHATYRSIIQNTLVMGWVTLAMVKILEVTLDIPTLVFVKGQWLPEVVARGVELSTQIDPSSIAHWPLLGAAIISAKATGIIVCFSVAAGYSAVSGLWGVMATDVFQFCLAMTGTIILMFVVFAVAGGPTRMVDQAVIAVNSGAVHNSTPVNREQISEQAIVGALMGKNAKTLKRGDTLAYVDREAQTTLAVNRLIEVGLLTRAEDESATLVWTATGLDSLAVAARLNLAGLGSPTAAGDDPLAFLRDSLADENGGKPNSLSQIVIGLWKDAYTVSRGHFKELGGTDELTAAGLLIEDLSADGGKLGYYRIPDLSLTEDQLLGRLDEAGIERKSEMMSAWRKDVVVAPSKITGFLPPFDLKNGGLTAIWAMIVFIGLQWWSGGEGGGFLAQRLFSCKDEKHSMLAMLWYNFAMFVLRPWPWIVVGVASLFLVPDVTAYGKHYGPEHAYVVMLMKYLPAGLRGLMVAALMAAYMSTISTHVNFGASYVVNDLYKRFVSPNGSERSLILVSKITTVFLAILAGIYAYYSHSIATGWYTFLELMSGAGFAVLLRWYWWRISAWSEIAAMASSLIMYMTLNHTPAFQRLFEIVGLGEYLYLLDEYAVRFTLNVVISTVIWVTVTFLTPPEKDEHLVKFYQRVQPPGGWKRIADAAGHPNHLSVGWIEWTGWGLGVTGLFAMIFSLGHACFGHYIYAAAFGAYGILATVLIFKLLGKMDWSSVTSESPPTD